MPFISEKAQGVLSLETPSGLSLDIHPLGCTLHNLQMPDSKGDKANILCDNPDSSTPDPVYRGVIVGRVANRIAHASMEVSGKNHALEANDGTHCLHGGPLGFHQKKFQLEASMSADNHAVIRGYCFSPSGEGGFPGDVTLTVTFKLTDKGELAVSFKAETSTLTPLNITHHPYWNLCGPSSPGIQKHRLYINASRFLEIDETKIPTGTILPLSELSLNLSEDVSLTDILSLTQGQGMDHCLILDKNNTVAASLTSPTGRKLEIETTQDCLQLYTGQYLAGVSGTDGTLKAFQALCLEPQGYVDAVHYQNFPQSLVDAGNIYEHSITYRFLNI